MTDDKKEFVVAAPASPAAAVTVEIDYTNWENKRALRKIIVQGRQLFFGQSEAHDGAAQQQQQWFIEAAALDRAQQTRTFAVKDIHSWTELDVMQNDSTIELEEDTGYTPTGGWKLDDDHHFMIEVSRDVEKTTIWLSMNDISSFRQQVCWTKRA